MSGKSLEALQTRYIQPRKCSIRASTSGDDVLRKMSTVSMDEPIINRKMSTLSEAYYDYQPCESDITPHINLGKTFQARVRKWADREIMSHELEAIPDRDECLFDCGVTEHLDEQTGKYPPTPGSLPNFHVSVLLTKNYKNTFTFGDLN